MIAVSGCGGTTNPAQSATPTTLPASSSLSPGVGSGGQDAFGSSASSAPAAGSAASGAGLPSVPPVSFYQPPDPLPAGAPGDLIRSMEIAAPPGGRAWAILYHSRGMEGEDIAISGIVAAPSGGASAASAAPDAGASAAPSSQASAAPSSQASAAPPSQESSSGAQDTGGRQVIAFAHGTAGLADPCAPSRDPVSGDVWALLWPVVARGFVVAATDYEGLGTPGPHPYMVGASEGRSVLDSVRAARQLPSSGAGSRVLLLGSSQGGHAALWAGQLAAAYAPDLEIVGIVAGSPAGDLRAIFQAELRSDAAPIARLESLMVFSAWHEVYGPSLDFLTPQARALAEQLQTSLCPEASQVVGMQIFARDPQSLPDTAPWNDLTAENTPGAERASAPILILQGTSDEQVPAESTVSVARRLCQVGDTVDLRLLPGVGHGTAVFTPSNVVATLAWVDDRFAGRPAASTCSG